MARPRAFDIEEAVGQALQLFWRKGYEGTTIGELTEALGINRPSLYAAFGSKEALFRRALERYVEGPGAELAAALAEKTARQVVRRLLTFYADAAGVPDRPKGCLLVQGALVSGDETGPIRDLLTEQRQGAEAALVARLERARREGDLCREDRPADLARYVWTLCHGIAVQAQGGATKDQLRRVVALAMNAWPAGGGSSAVSA